MPNPAVLRHGDASRRSGQSDSLRRKLLVGEAPSRRDTVPNGRPLSGRPGRKIADLAGITLPELLELVETENLLRRWPGPAGKGSAFDMDRARARAKSMNLRGAEVVLLGRRTSAAFGLPALPYLMWVGHRGARVAVLPHPSGVNRWWNERENTERARRFLRGWLRG